ncbi:hypothetical protein JB92DRAFT_3116741 [Gautieria morchelliformis]|nr:hypothetical protein JB92DRAFT_3116741 [Gautieria morchelliformis]
MSPLQKSDNSLRASLGRDKCQAAPNFITNVPIAKDKFSNKSKVQPHPNFAALKNHEPDVIHELEMLDFSTASQTSKSKKKKKSLAVAASVALKKGGLRREEAS